MRWLIPLLVAVSILTGGFTLLHALHLLALTNMVDWPSTTASLAFLTGAVVLEAADERGEL